MLSNHKGESVLDRAVIESDTPDDDLTELQDTVDTEVHLSKRSRLGGKVKSLLHISDDQVVFARNTDCVTLADSPDVMDRENRLDETSPPKPGSQGMHQMIQHPVDIFEAKTQHKTNQEVATNLLSPEVTHAQDVELIHAQNTLNSAQIENAQAKACEDLEILKKARQDLFTTPERERKEPGSQGTPRGAELGRKAYALQLVFQLAEKYGGQYIGSFAEPLPASQETITASVERLLSPWQELAMHTRRIYRWEDRKESSMYLVAFLVLWAYGWLAIAACLGLIAQVLRRRFEKPSVEKLRQDTTRTEDSLSTAHTLSEQIEKRGAHGWIDPLIEASDYLPDFYRDKRAG
ncbi:MAG: hypothetical protein Q9169_005833 [Polycauliona sp. 2 TL-2023]